MSAMAPPLNRLPKPTVAPNLQNILLLLYRSDMAEAVRVSFFTLFFSSCLLILNKILFMLILEAYLVLVIWSGPFLIDLLCCKFCIEFNYRAN